LIIYVTHFSTTVAQERKTFNKVLNQIQQEILHLNNKNIILLLDPFCNGVVDRFSSSVYDEYPIEGEMGVSSFWFFFVYK